MLHSIRLPGRRVFSTSERAIVLAIAEAVIPAGRMQGGAGPEVVERFEDYTATLGKSGALTFRGIIHGIDAQARATTLRSFPRLPVEKRLEILESWRTGSFLRRQTLRVFLAPLKIAHFDSKSF